MAPNLAARICVKTSADPINEGRGRDLFPHLATHPAKSAERGEATEGTLAAGESTGDSDRLLAGACSRER